MQLLLIVEEGTLEINYTMGISIIAALPSDLVAKVAKLLG